MGLKKEDAIKSCVGYILAHEYNDFLENPSKMHVYYSALVARYGEKEADERLEATILSLEEETGETYVPF